MSEKVKLLRSWCSAQDGWCMEFEKENGDRFTCKGVYLKSSSWPAGSCELTKEELESGVRLSCE